MSPAALGDLLLRAADRDPAGAAVVSQEGEPVTWSELLASASAIAGGLHGAGVRRGDRVLLAQPNGLDLCRSIFGVALAGAAFTPVNPTMKRDKLAAIIRLAEPAAVLCDGEREPTARAAAELAGGPPTIAQVPELAGGGPAPGPAAAEDLAAIMFTSGSTGEPKGVTLTQDNMTFVTGSIVSYLELTDADRVLSVLPLSFGYGLSQLLCCAWSGATLVLAPPLTFPGRFVQALEEHAITGLPGVPTLFQVLTSLAGLRERELPHLRYITSAGAPIPGPTREAVLETFPGVSFFHMYGQTECTRVSYLPPDQVAVRPDSVGIPIPGTEAWVERPGGGGRAAPGEVGELMVSGRHVMQGYWRDPEGTEARVRPGRGPGERVLATGDLFRSDEEGYLYFVSRSDDVIKSRGEKVAPKEVEDAIYALPGVREVAVVGVADALLGQAVHAHVALAEGAELDTERVRRHCAATLEDHMIPRQVHFHDALPRTPNGKLDRRSLSSP